MGYFAIPPKPESEMTAADYVKCVIANLELWQASQTSDYLLTSFAKTMLQKAIDLSSKPQPDVRQVIALLLSSIGSRSLMPDIVHVHREAQELTKPGLYYYLPNAKAEIIHLDGWEMLIKDILHMTVTEQTRSKIRNMPVGYVGEGKLDELFTAGYNVIRYLPAVGNALWGTNVFVAPDVAFSIRDVQNIWIVDAAVKLLMELPDIKHESWAYWASHMREYLHNIFNSLRCDRSIWDYDIKADDAAGKIYVTFRSTMITTPFTFKVERSSIEWDDVQGHKVIDVLPYVYRAPLIERLEQLL